MSLRYGGTSMQKGISLNIMFSPDLSFIMNTCVKT